jgi:hypothetical protein
MAAAPFDSARCRADRVNDSRAADTARLGAPALRSSRNVIFRTVRQAVSWRAAQRRRTVYMRRSSLRLVGEVKRLLDEAKLANAG